MVIDLKKLQEENKELKKKSKKSKSLKLKSPPKVLKKPTAKLSSYSAKRFISSLAAEQGGLVTQQDPLRERYENPQIDNRSLYFRESFKHEKKKAFGGFI